MSNVGEKAENPVVMVSKSHGDTRPSSRPAETQEWIAADAQRGLRPSCSNTGSRVLSFTPVKSSNFRQEDVCVTLYYMPLYVPSQHSHLRLCPGCAPTVPLHLPPCPSSTHHPFVPTHSRWWMSSFAANLFCVKKQDDVVAFAATSPDTENKDLSL